MIHFGFVALALCWLLPNHYPPWMSFQSEWLACVAACLMGAGLLYRKRELRWSALAIAALLAAVVPLVQWATGLIMFHSDAILSATYVAGFALCIAVGAGHMRHDKEFFLDGLFGSLVAAAVISSAIALAQWLGFGESLLTIDIPRGGRPYANLGQPNHLATLLALGALGLLRWYEQGRMSGAVLGLGWCWLGFGMVMTQSRVSWMFVGTIGLWLLLNRRRVSWRLPVLGVAAGAGTFVLGVLAWRPLNDLLFLSTATTLGERIKPGMRLVHWHTLWDALWTRPLSGFGWMQVSMAQEAGSRTPDAGGELLFNSHNFMLDLLIWNGVPIGVVLLLVLAWWFWKRIRACKSVDQCVLLAAIATVFMHGMVEYPLSYAYFLLPVGFMMGALDGMAEETRTWRMPMPAAVSAVVAAMAMTLYTGAQYLKVEEAGRIARLVGARIGVDRVAEAPPPDVWLIDGQREYIRFINTPAVPGMSEAQLDWMRQLTRRFTYAAAMYRLALAEGLNGHPKEAQERLESLCRLHGKLVCDELRVDWTDRQAEQPQLRQIQFPQATLSK